MARRNPKAMDAWLRGGAGPMKHRNTPRGGARRERMPLCTECRRNAVQFEDEDSCSWCMEKRRKEQGEE